LGDLAFAVKVYPITLVKLPNRDIYRGLMDAFTPEGF